MNLWANLWSHPLYLLLPPLITAFLSLGLLGLVLTVGWRNPLHRTFALLLITVILWAGLLFAMRASPTPQQALGWGRLMLADIFILGLAFFSFVLRYTKAQPGATSRAGVYTLLLLSALASTPLLVRGVEVTGYGYEPVWGPAFLPSISLLLLLGGMVFLHLWQARAAASSYEDRNAISYIFLGMMALALGGVLDSLFPSYPGSILGGLVFCILTTFSVWRYHLVDVPIALHHAITYALTGLILAIPYTLVTLQLNWMMGHEGWNGMPWHLSLLALGVSLPWVWRRLRKGVERVFYGRRYPSLIALRNFSQQPWGNLNVKELATTLTGLVGSALGTEKVWLLLPSNGGFAVAAGSASNHDPAPTLSRDSLLVRRVETHHTPLLKADAQSLLHLHGGTGEEQFLLREHGVELFVPFKFEGTLVGILLIAGRPSGEPYSPADLALLHQVGERVGATLHNAQLYSEQKETVEELLRLNRLRLGFISTLAHEFKTPLTALKAAAGLLKHPQGQETRDRVIASLNTNIARLEEKVEESLKLAQIEAGALELRREPMSVKRLVEETALALGPMVSSKEQSIAVQVLEQLPRVSVDRARFQDILFNLMGNAVKFSPQGAQVTVSLYRQGKELVVEVADQAPALSPQEREHIFDPRRRQGGGQLGGGLGLAIAKGLVEQHGGRIWVEGGPAGGNRFSFSVPLRVHRNGRRRKG